MTRVDWLIMAIITALVAAIIITLGRGAVDCYRHDCGPGKRAAFVDYGGCVCVERAQ